MAFIKLNGTHLVLPQSIQAIIINEHAPHNTPTLSIVLEHQSISYALDKKHTLQEYQQAVEQTLAQGFTHLDLSASTLERSISERKSADLLASLMGESKKQALTDPKVSDFNAPDYTKPKAPKGALTFARTQDGVFLNTACIRSMEVQTYAEHKVPIEPVSSIQFIGTTQNKMDTVRIPGVPPQKVLDILHKALEKQLAPIVDLRASAFKMAYAFEQQIKNETLRDFASKLGIFKEALSTPDLDDTQDLNPSSNPNKLKGPAA